MEGKRGRPSDSGSSGDIAGMPYCRPECTRGGSRHGSGATCRFCSSMKPTPGALRFSVPQAPLRVPFVCPGTRHHVFSDPAAPPSAIPE